MLGAEPALSTAENYRRFARGRGQVAPVRAQLCEGVARDPELLALLDRVPPAKRQPNLLLGAVRLLSGTTADFAGFRAAILGNPDAITAVLLSRRTQTNEPGRCAALLPLLAGLPQPLALLEVARRPDCACCPTATPMTTAASGSATRASRSRAGRRDRCRCPRGCRTSPGAPGWTWIRSTCATTRPCAG